MSVADNLNRIIQAKSDIKTAIEKKGVDVGDITIDKYAEKIDLIEQGGGSGGKIKVKEGICLSGSTFTTFDASNWDWSNVYDCSYMFNGCEKVETITGLNISDVYKIDSAFANCKKLTDVSFVEKWNCKGITTYYQTFQSCNMITKVDLSNWDFSNATTVSYMFGYCYALKEVRFGGPIRSDVNTLGMFQFVDTTGTFYYPKEYDYSKIINALPSKWTAVAY